MWTPLHTHSHFSLLDGLSKPEAIAKRIAECEYGAIALTDHGSISGCPAFYSAIKKAGKKPILGEEFYVSPQDSSVQDATNRQLSHLCVLAKNQQGWRNLMRASSVSYKPENFYYKPRLDLDKLGEFANGEWIAFSGHLGSDLANIIFTEPKLAYDAKTYEEAKSLADPDWLNRTTALINRYKDLFGAENFFIEIQLIDHRTIPAAKLVADGLRYAARKTDTRCIATADSHYCRKEDARDQRVLLAIALDTTLTEVNRRIEAGDDVSLGTFFKSNNYHIPSLAEMQELHTEEELANTMLIADMIEEINLGGQPMFPSFDSAGKTAKDLLREHCIHGWRERIAPVLSPENEDAYKERVKRELGVINDADLANYFLIVEDYCKWSRSQGMLLGPGRGSAAGCLVSYLLYITRVDPVANELIFERFYNAGRNTPGRIALPDIDTDFPKYRREEVIEYCRNKYGRDRVAQMATFARMQGKGAMKDVLRAHGKVGFDEMNKITSPIPDEAEISDQLQEMQEETGEASIIRWALENEGEALKEWAYLDDDGTIQGPLAFEFAQAIRIEGTKRSMGRHASGLVICSETLSDVCPMVYDKNSEEMILGVDMRDAEEMGLVKFDILGTTVLDKIQRCVDIAAGKA